MHGEIKNQNVEETILGGGYEIPHTECRGKHLVIGEENNAQGNVRTKKI